MTEIYALELPIADASNVGSLRTNAGVEVCEARDRIWLRTVNPAEALRKKLRGLPGALLFAVSGDGQLCRIGSRVPRGHLPEGPWIELSTWLEVRLPTAALPAELPNRIPLSLVADQVYRESNLLLTSLAEWTAYGVTAPQVRLDRWHFAVSEKGDVIVRGTPLPPLAGTRLVEEHGIAVPSGWHWSPAVDADVLTSLFQLATHDVLLWTPQGRRERIAAEQFVRATRSAIRLSARGPNDGQ
jgi:MoxR-vWA-beta-propeller ternary system domain bpX2